MDTKLIIYIVSIIALVAMSAFFSATETAFSSINRIRVKGYAENGNKKAVTALKLAQFYDKTLSAILIGNNIVNILSASLGTILFTNIFGASGVGISTVVMTIVVLLFGEIMPKSFAKANAESFALNVAYIMNFICIIFTPFTFVIMKLKALLIRGKGDDEKAPSVTEEELKTIIEEIEDEGVLEAKEGQLAKMALDFDEITVSEILVPRVDVVAVDVEDSLDSIYNTFITERFSRIPVFEKTIDNIIGIINIREFFQKYHKNEQFDIKSIMLKPIFVPPAKKISELLTELQKSKMHMSIVTDQYGGTLGIITIEDIVEELVGEIWDEYDEVTEAITKRGEDKYDVMGDTNIYDLCDMLDIDEPEEDFQSNTLGGTVAELLGKIPAIGDTCEFGVLKITVTGVVANRVTKLFVEKTQALQEEE